MIFCTGTKKNIRCFLRIFNSYYEVSGQKINNAKSRFFTGSMTDTRVSMDSNWLGFTPGSFPSQYLGCPIFVGKPKCIFFRPITDKIKVKLAT
jgi:hypothetical protein